MKVSVIMPVERVDARRAIDSVLAQEAPFPFELIVVSAAPLELPAEARVRNVVEPNRNPATRRNRAASAAAGEILAFIDDDATADAHWLATACAYLDANPDVLALGGPDPAPDDSTVAELFADTLLATRWIGSGVIAHENRSGVFAISHASDIALVNLFVRREVFGSGFDEEIGYIGEDTALVEQVMARGRVVYHSGVRVHHRRRAFPGPYLRQRWRYRVKTGKLLMQPSYRGNPKIGMFFAGAAVMLLFFPIMLPLYFLGTLVLGATATRLPRRFWPAIPLAFAAHHLTYFVAILWGALAARLQRRRA